MEWVIVIVYILSLLFIFLFSLGQLHLTWHYWQNKRSNKKQALQPYEGKNGFGENQDYPMVTVQLPIYNELYVVQRLIDAVAAFDYPRDKFEIQVLDDSTDETYDLIKAKVSEVKNQGIQIHHVPRDTREGYKAGALQLGLEKAKGEFIAIFDADFLPESSFLKKTLPAFSDPYTGAVQTRWGHINKDFNLLTRLQAFGLDGHFTVEQVGRSHAGSFINFNGTGGIWRKSCIKDAGGWSADTLTEDLDLSYRAQMKAWKIQFMEGVATSGELPVIMPAIKSQQFRWNKGAAECATKNLKNVFRTEFIRGNPFNWVNKFHAFFHLFNSSIFLFLLIASLLSIPMLFILDANPWLNPLVKAGAVLIIGFFSIAFFYWTASKQLNPDNTWHYYLKNFPLFLIVTMGLSLYNAIAVLEGLLGFKTAFVRTPKFNIKSNKDRWQNNIYLNKRITPASFGEAFLALYFLAGIATGFYLNNFGLLIFHLMLALGFAGVAWYSIKQSKYA